MLAKYAIHLSPVVKIDATQYRHAIAAMLRRWLQRRRERDELARMTELELKDLGLVPADRHSLLRARFWQCYPFADEDERGSTRNP